MARKIALVTGVSRGLGRDMAMALSQKGLDIILTYHSKNEEAEKVAASIVSQGSKAAILPFDVSDFNSFESFLGNLRQTLSKDWNTDRFDYLINNAGVGATIPIAEVTEEDFDPLMNIHFKSVYFLTQKALDMMNEDGGMVFVSSGTTRFCMPGYSVSSA